MTKKKEKIITVIALITAVALASGAGYAAYKYFKPAKKPARQEKPLVKIAEPAIKEVSFSYPYPVFWEEDGFQFTLTKVGLGKISAPANLFKSSGFSFFFSDYYKLGELVPALILTFKIEVLPEHKFSVCVPMKMRRLLNEEGDLAVPNSKQFVFPESRDCHAKPNATYENQRVIFVVPEAEKEFYITTGGKTDMFFTITVTEDGSLKVETLIEKG